MLQSTSYLLPYSQEPWSVWQTRAWTQHHCTCPSAGAQILPGRSPQMTRPFAMGRKNQQHCIEQAQPSRPPLFSSCARMGLPVKPGRCWGTGITCCVRPLSRRGWIGGCKEKDRVDERALKAASLWQGMDMDMERLGSRTKVRKGHGGPAIDLSRHQPDISPVQPML